MEIVLVPGGGSSASAAKSAKGAKSVKAVKAAKLAKLAKMGKMVRVLRIARLLRWFSYDQKSSVVIALRGLNLKAYRDEILSLLGQNGAGKSTFFSMLMGIAVPTSGTCIVEGTDILQSPELVRKYVGSCPQHDILFDHYTIEEHLRLYAVMKSIGPLDLENAVAATLAQVGLTRKKDDFVNSLSGGMRRRTSIAMACLGNPHIILLDEPSAGVDIVNRQIVWKSLVQLKKNRTIVMSTHFMEEAEILGDRVAVLKKGQLQVCGSCVELHNMFGAGYTLVITRPISGEKIGSADALKQLDLAKKQFIKKASDVMEPDDAQKIADDCAKNFKKHLGDGPALKKKVALAAEEVEVAKVREGEQAKLKPDKLLEFIQQFIPEADLLDYTEEQAFIEYVAPSPTTISKASPHFLPNLLLSPLTPTSLFLNLLRPRAGTCSPSTPAASSRTRSRPSRGTRATGASPPSASLRPPCRRCSSRSRTSTRRSRTRLLRRRRRGSAAARSRARLLLRSRRRRAGPPSVLSRLLLRCKRSRRSARLPSSGMAGA